MNDDAGSSCRFAPVLFLFEKKGLIVVSPTPGDGAKGFDDIFDIAVEAGAEDVKEVEGESGPEYEVGPDEAPTRVHPEANDVDDRSTPRQRNSVLSPTYWDPRPIGIIGKSNRQNWPGYRTTPCPSRARAGIVAWGSVWRVRRTSRRQ